MKLAVIAAVLAVPIAALAASAAHPVPVVVELFTSEGCSSCPPADRLLAALNRQQPVPGVEIIALEEHVDYWNSQGWTDSFSSADWTTRQTRYARLDPQGTYTPQMVVDGEAAFIGSDSRRALQEIARAAATPGAPCSIDAKRDANGVAVSVEASGAPSKAQVLVALVLPSASSSVTAGENRGLTLAHSSVALSLTHAGSLKPGATLSRRLTIPLPHGVTGTVRAVVIVQDSKSLRILGAAETAPAS